MYKYTLITQASQRVMIYLFVICLMPSLGIMLLSTTGRILAATNILYEEQQCSPSIGLGTNLIANGDAEANSGAIDATTVVTPACWGTSPNFTVIRYGVNGFPISTTVPAGGMNFFAGGPSTIATATQKIDVTPLSSIIDSGEVYATLSGFLGGYAGQGDNITVDAEFYSTNQQILQQMQIGPATAQERASRTALFSRAASVMVPTGTRLIIVSIVVKRSEGSSNDGYGDNISLVFETCNHSPQIGANLLVNADAEIGGSAVNDASSHPVFCWSVNPNFSAVRYGAAVLVTSGAFPSRSNGGNSFFAGGLNSVVATATQTIDISRLSNVIDSGSSVATLSALLGGYADHRDNLVITAEFQSGDRQSLAITSIGPISVADRRGATKFLSRSATTVVPIGARRAVVTMVAKRLDGLYNDGYADDISLIIEPTSCEVPFFWQRDVRWNAHPLRTNGGCTLNTIGEGGCTLSSAAMLFKYYGANETSSGLEMNPLNLSDCMNANACPFSWATGAQCSNTKASNPKSNGFSWELLDQEINQARHQAILGMRLKKNGTDTHWVLVLEGSGNDPANYTIHDPWFEGGAYSKLSSRAKDWDFYRIVTYEGQSACYGLGISQSTLQVKDGENHAPDNFDEFASPIMVSTILTDSPTISGSVQIYSITDISMTVKVSAQSKIGNASEMLVWTDTLSNTTWQPLNQYIHLPVSDFVYARFRDTANNVSNVFKDTINPVGPPDEPNLERILLPIILK